MYHFLIDDDLEYYKHVLACRMKIKRRRRQFKITKQ